MPKLVNLLGKSVAWSKNRSVSEIRCGPKRYEIVSRPIAQNSCDFLDYEKIWNKDECFLNAVTYFNQIVLKTDGLKWNHIIELFRLFRGEKEDSKLHSLRVQSASDKDLQSKFNIIKSANDATFIDREKSEVVEHAFNIYYRFAGQFFYGLDGFNRADTFRAGHPAGGHHRTAWFVMNYFLIKNGFDPFYFIEDEYKHLTDNGYRNVNLIEFKTLLYGRINTNKITI